MVYTIINIIFAVILVLVLCDNVRLKTQIDLVNKMLDQFKKLLDTIQKDQAKTDFEREHYTS